MATESQSTESTNPGPPPENLHVIQVKLAFGNEGRVRARPATLVEVDEEHVTVHYLDGSEETVDVVRPDRLGELLARDDLCRLRDRPLLLVNTYYRVLAIATGPSSPPSQLKASTVFAFENDSVTEVLPIEDGQPTLRTLALVSANDRSDKDVTK